MCGRFSLHSSTGDLVDRFRVSQGAAEIAPRYNIAPAQLAPVLFHSSEGGGVRLEQLQWGLIPSWAKDPSVGSRLINARAETLTEKPAFREAFARRRCLIPADGFYEWRRHGSEKQPMHIHREDGGLFAFAGLWDEWRATDGRLQRTFTIITVEPNPLLAAIHPRMPAILLPAEEAIWLQPESRPEGLLALLRPYQEDLAAYPVSNAVNSPAIDDPVLLQKAEDLSLFDL